MQAKYHLVCMFDTGECAYRPGTVESMSEREKTAADGEPAGESNLPAVEPDELPDVGELQKRVVEEEEAPRGSTEEGGPLQERPDDR